MTKQKRIKLLERAIDALRDANKGQGLNAASDAVARACDAAILALREVEAAR